MVRTMDEGELFRASDSFKRQGFCRIPDFLSGRMAHELYRYLTAEENEARWEYCYKRGPLTEIEYIPQLKSNANRIEQLKTLLTKMDTFSFRFSRMRQHGKKCSCPLCEVGRIFQNVEVLRAITNINIGKERQYLFASRFGCGDYLARHEDRDHGRINVLLYLTQNWQPEFGGLNFVLSSQGEIQRVLVPKFNELYLIDMASPHRHPHFVSMVIVKAREPRLAVTGWLSEEAE